MLTILLVVLILAAIGVLPHWPYAAGWGTGYGPSGLLGFVIIVVLVLLILGHR